MSERLKKLLMPFFIWGKAKIATQTCVFRKCLFSPGLRVCLHDKSHSIGRFGTIVAQQGIHPRFAVANT
jgi:hypothetical protein